MRFRVVYTIAWLCPILSLAACNKSLIYNGTGQDPTFVAKTVKVFEYTPAPGQFINDPVIGGFAGEDTPAEAIEYAEKRLNYVFPAPNEDQRGLFVSLGGFGGYIVVGFGESIVNSGDTDFSITGNQFEGSSEPGVVWVMQDLNGDGVPNDDAWYELRGSETGKPATVQNYEVTYFRPKEDGADVAWTDNKGGGGVIGHNKFHVQPSYFPAWIAGDSYTLRGTLLESRTVKDEITGRWVNDSYEWGYADNLGSDSGETGSGSGDSSNRSKVYFKISNAVDADGEPVGLPSIDFIKVQTAVCAVVDDRDDDLDLGELSTEVCGFAIENL